MPLYLNTNVTSLTAQRQFARSSAGLEQALARLSSGARVNSARDDAAGLAIAERMTTQIRGLDQAVRNANDGVSLVQTAESALVEVTNMLQRMRELSLQSLNDTNSENDRAALNQEMQQLLGEIDRIGGTTQFNGQGLLNGTLTGQAFQVGANVNENIEVDIGQFTTDALGTRQLDGLGTQVRGQNPDTSEIVRFSGETLTLFGDPLSSDIVVPTGASAEEIATLVGDVTGDTGVSATALTEVELTFSDPVAYNIRIRGDDGSSIPLTLNITDPATPDGLAAAVSTLNAVSDQTGVTASVSSDGAGIMLTHPTGGDIEFTDDGVNTAGSVITVGGAGGVNIVGGNGQIDRAFITGAVRFTATHDFRVSSTDANETLSGRSVAAIVDPLDTADILTTDSSNIALAKIDAALSAVSDQRALLGAVENRFDSAIRSMLSASQDLNASRSRIVDADFAQESAALAREQILQQAGTAVLTQANLKQQTVLSLLET